ncbi:MAG: AMP-binding protein, partial [Rhizomicrobium sp.]
MTDTATKPWPAMSIAEATAQLTAPGTRLEMEIVDICGIPTRVWKNAPQSNREVFLAGRAFGDREFLVYEDDRCTYDAFARATLKLADRLQRDGVEKGDRVAIIMRNLPEWVVAFYAGELV